MNAMEARKDDSMQSSERPDSLSWVPRHVRCPRCTNIANEEVRERVADDEIAVRYGCESCDWRQIRHYYTGS